MAASAEAAQECVAVWALQLDAARELLATHASSLPSYDAEAAHQLVTKLRDEADTARAQITPRSKFRFGAKRTPTTTAAQVPPVPPPEDDGPAPPASSGAAEALFARLGAAEATIADRSPGSVVILSDSGDSTTSASDVRLLRCRGTTFVILRKLAALRVDGLEDCVVVSTPVAGSVLLHDCQRCTLIVAARQFRLHRSVDCLLSVHAMSRPIIEGCRNFRFAPYALERLSGGGVWQSARAQLVDAGLLESEAATSAKDVECVSSWRHVDDFEWIKAQASPHWRVASHDEWHALRLPEAADGQLRLGAPADDLPRDVPLAHEHVHVVATDDDDEL